MYVPDRADLQFPLSLPEFQRLCLDDATCAAYLERYRWGDGFACPSCGVVGQPYRIATRPGMLKRRCEPMGGGGGLRLPGLREPLHRQPACWAWPLQHRARLCARLALDATSERAGARLRGEGDAAGERHRRARALRRVRSAGAVVMQRRQLLSAAGCETSRRGEPVEEIGLGYVPKC